MSTRETVCVDPKTGLRVVVLSLDEIHELITVLGSDLKKRVGDRSPVLDWEIALIEKLRSVLD